MKRAAHADMRASGNKFFQIILPARIAIFYRRHNGAPILGINSASPIHRGRSHEASCKWDRMRRLRAGLVTPLPGGPGSPSVPTKRDCLEWLDAARTKGGESCPDQGGGCLPSVPGSYGPGDRKAAMERRSARVLRQGRARRKAWIDEDAPLGAPSPRYFVGGQESARASRERLRRTRRRQEYGQWRLREQ